MKSDLGRYELDYSNREENKTVAILTFIAWAIAIAGIVIAFFLFVHGSILTSGFVLMASLAVGALFRGMAEIIKLLQSILLQLKQRK
ncbi:hypothetical protein [Paenibacillus sp. OV219]|uniref:hypothetical protein n=1 Tax=Paenibacillus sp. OV219 TaxID=1884377 RepID=UPI0008D03D3A|nr:hypothetical protein [Paenibacillus sp. OV219]SEO97786.1 hypothetical protein SAMN05518847_113168 [Paenibacillus sp. OV219]